MPKLVDVADLIMGQSPPSSTYNEDGNGLPFFQGKADFGFQYPTPRVFCTEPTRIAKKGDILISVRAPVGSTNYADRQCGVGRGLAAIRCRDIDTEFLFYNLRYIEGYIASLGTGSTFKAINKLQLANLEVNPQGILLSEQRAIAHILSTVQRAIEQQVRIIEVTTELKKALMRKLFTEGLRGEPQKETEIGSVPESWQVVQLGDLLDQSQYGLSVKGEETGRFAILRMTNQINGKISTEDLQYVNIADDECAKFRLERGDVLFNRTNSFELVGRTAILDIDGDFVFASYLLRLRTDTTKLNPFFLNHYLNSQETQVRLKSIATRAVSQSNISATRLRGFIIPLPSIQEQTEIASHLDTLDKKISLHQNKEQLYQDLFSTLLQQLMTGQARVQNLVVNSTNEVLT